MKKQALSILIIAFITISMFIPAAMADDCCPSETTARIDHKSTVDGYQLEYEFVDIREKMKDMKEMGHSMENMTATHHLMLFIKNAQGEPVVADQAGFLIKGPDGKKQQAMAMSMSSGHGADIDLSTPGEYTIKTKAVAGDVRLIDSFTHSVK